VVDECHHLSAQSFERVARRAKARFVLGLSATVTRKDGHQPIIFMQCGPVRDRVGARAQAALRPFRHSVIVRPTRFVSSRLEESDKRIQFQSLYAELVQDEHRNEAICDDMLDVVRAGRSPSRATRLQHQARLPEARRNGHAARHHRSTRNEERVNMEWLHLASYFVGGAFLANSVPHFVCGVMGKAFQSPFAKPPGQGLSSSTVNVLWGFFNIVVGYMLVCRVGDFGLKITGDVFALGFGILAIGLFSARHFGRFNGGHVSEPSDRAESARRRPHSPKQQRPFLE
jgi:hypothetical protein